MNLRDWNDFLWRVIGTRLYKPGSRLYLAFDESLLEDEFNIAGIGLPHDGPTSELNRIIQLHCRPISNGFLGLSAEPDGRCCKDNWWWVYEPGEEGHTLALTFAVQQILAAEHMQRVSFYTAYWGMLGVTSDETRINPFGDQGKYSFKMLWAQLRKELVEIVGVAEIEITFTFGQGSNKFRNLPVSQSLLSEGDMRLARSAIHRASSLSDDRLYAELRRARLSSSGRRKVHIAPLKDSLLAQFREYLDSGETNGIVNVESNVRRLRPKIGVSNLLLYEDFELFGGSVFHCVSTDESITVSAALASYFDENRFLIFEEGEGRIAATTSQILGKAEAQVFILGQRETIEEMLRCVPSDGGIPPLKDHFALASSSITGDLLLLRCISLPSTLENVDISKNIFRRIASVTIDEFKIEFRGGLCVNKSSNAYIVGFGPQSILCDGVKLAQDSSCELDSEIMEIERALGKLSKATGSCRYMIRIADKILYINMVEGEVPRPRPAYIMTDWCILPVAVMGDGQPEDTVNVGFVSDVNSCAWPLGRNELIRKLSSEIARPDIRWIKTDRPSTKECLMATSYLDLPRALVEQVERKIKATRLVPWPLFHWFTAKHM